MGVSDQLRQTKKGNLSYERHTSETNLKVTDRLVNHDLNSYLDKQVLAFQKSWRSFSASIVCILAHCIQFSCLSM